MVDRTLIMERIGSNIRLKDDFKSINEKSPKFLYVDVNEASVDSFSNKICKFVDKNNDYLVEVEIKNNEHAVKISKLSSLKSFFDLHQNQDIFLKISKANGDKEDAHLQSIHLKNLQSDTSSSKKHETTDLIQTFEKFDELHEQRLDIENRARLGVSFTSYALLFIMGLQTGIVSRLTWWELSWDIMEPVTYILTLMTSILGYSYYLVTKQDYDYQKVDSMRFKKNLNVLLKKNKFDIKNYNKILDLLKNTKI